MPFHTYKALPSGKFMRTKKSDKALIRYLESSSLGVHCNEYRPQSFVNMEIIMRRNGCLPTLHSMVIYRD